MLYLSSLFVLLFTLQFIYIVEQTKQTPHFGLLTLWGLLFLFLFINHKKWYFPADHPHYASRKQLVQWGLIGIIFLASSGVYLQYTIEQTYYSPLKDVIEKEQENRVFVTGIVDSKMSIKENRARFILKVAKVNDQKLNKQEQIIVTRFFEEEEELRRLEKLSKGSIFTSRVELEQPSTARNKGAFDYKTYLNRKGIHYQGQVLTANWQKEQSTSWWTSSPGLLDELRDRWLQQIERLFSKDIAPIIQSFTVGYRDNVEEEMVHIYQNLGIIHLLAISGLHIGIFIWALYALLCSLKITREKVIFLLQCLIPMYIYVCGASPSVIRAGIMGMLALWCVRYHWKKQIIFILYLVYIGTLLYRPFYLYEVGYQLSFSITFSLVVAYKPLHQFYSKKIKTKSLSSLFSLVLISSIAQISSLPILLYHFYQFSPLSLIINVLIVPLYSIVFIPGAITLTVLSFISREWLSLFVWFYELNFSYVHSLFESVYHLPWSNLVLGQPNSWWILLYYLSVIFSLALLELKMARAFYISFILLPCLLILQILLPYFDKNATIMMLDVGQGDAIVIELPYREEVIIIDTGGQQNRYRKKENNGWKWNVKEWDVAKNVILPYLHYRGINHIDRLIISHSHFDHYGGLKGLFRKISINKIYINDDVLMLLDIKGKGQKNSIHSRNLPLTKGDIWEFKESTFVVLSPSKGATIDKHVSVNNQGIVLWSKIYGTTFLWTGDIEQEKELELLEQFPNLSADILKVAHHGSKTSTTKEFMKQLEPREALISVGKQNRYGHPSKELLERLRQKDIHYYRTDIHGGIQIEVSPKEAIIKTVQ